MEKAGLRILIKARLNSKSGALFIALSLASLGISLPFIASFIAPGLDIYLALMALPFCLVIEQKGIYATRYGWLSLVLATLYMVLQVQTLYFLAIVALICFVIEQTVGKLSKTFMLIGVLISPVFHYLLNVFSFPIRLKITAFAGQLLSLFMDGIAVTGNLIIFKERTYEVESACLGLGMLVTGAILCLAVLAYITYKKQQRIKHSKFALWFLVSAALLISSNLFRIIILVLFNIAPNNPSHDIAGLFSLLFYVIIPLWFITPRLVNGKPFLTNLENIAPINLKITTAPLLITCLLLVGANKFNSYKNEVKKMHFDLPIGLKGFEQSQPYADVMKYKNDESVIFYKPCKSFFNSTHTPTICWRGSGLKLKNEQMVEVNNQPILKAVLVNDSTKLYTAWWYQSESVKTVDQIEWRYDVFKNKTQYTLVNVSSLKEASLNALLRDYFLK